MATTTAAPLEVRSRTGLGVGALAVAGIASLGAGAVHAAAIGVHAGAEAAARTFAVLALLQLAWGAAALVRQGRLLALAGIAVNGGAVVGWVLAKTSGIGFIEGLDAKEAIQWPDLSAAVLAALAVLVALRVLLSSRPDGDGDGGGERTGPRAPGRLALGLPGVALTALAMTGMVATGGHSHAGGDHHGTGTEAAAGADHAHDGTEADDHPHPDPGATTEGTDGTATTEAAHEHPAAVAKPYDPAKPIDLSGTEGVTEAQQAAAENLIAITLIRLPKFADPAAATAAGYHSIGDGFTGHEHFINWDLIDDGRTLDPDYPESLVYEPQSDGSRKLVSAMFMLGTGTTLDDVPELGGQLTQWHIHDDLCFSTDPDAPTVAGITSPGGTCSGGLKKFDPVPMIHVWITKHRCGPFAALEGVGAGQIEEGEERLCDTAHGH